MLNKPKFMSPSINMYGNSVIDLNSTVLPFSCVIDGNEPIVKWQIVVSRLSDNAEVFDTGEQTLETPFLPIDNRNRNVVFTIDLKKHFNSSAKLCYIAAESTHDSNKVYYLLDGDEYTKYEYNESTWGTGYTSLFYTNFINSSDAYYWKIVLWGGLNGKTVSYEEVFYANSIPEITFNYSKDNDIYEELIDKMSLDRRMYYFKATYKQAEDIPLKKYGWRITDVDNDKVILNSIDENQIYGLSSDISCQYNGFVNNTNCLIELFIETQNGYFSIVKRSTFKINYDVKTLITDFNIQTMNSSSCIMLDWEDLKTTEGVVDGDDVSRVKNYPIANKTNSIRVGNGSSVIFEGNANAALKIPEDVYAVLSFQITKDENMTLLEMTGVDELSYTIKKKLAYISDSKTLVHSVEKTNGDSAIKRFELSNRPGDAIWYVVTLHPLTKDEDGNCSVDISVVESVAQGTLYPEDNLYPDDGLYPYSGSWTD